MSPTAPHRLSSLARLLLLLCVVMAAPAARTIAQEPAAGGEFFERRIRPLLIRHCDSCHGKEQQEGGLRLDSRAAVLAGGDRGPAFRADDPDKSLLLAAVRRMGDLQMPPDDPLSPRQLRDLEQWVRGGLHWPTVSAPDRPSANLADRLAYEREHHWAYQPVRRPDWQSGTADAAAWALRPLDYLVWRNLRAVDLQPSPEADRRTLIRRVYFDLLGVPPTAAEVRRFVEDRAADAYEQLVERVLASPRYGERWGRHWLDVARYADTKGYAFGRERRYPYAYTYRDYVIDAWNRDLPYDQFIVEQLAADLMPDARDGALAGLGFLTVGRKFNNRHDDLDDQIDAVTRGFLGLSVACARCHDHKYDLVPTADYYSLYGVFASSREPDTLPLLGDPTATPGYEAFKRELDRRQQELADFEAQQLREMIATARERVTDYLVRAVSTQPEKLLQKLPFISLSREELKPPLVVRWRQYLLQHARADHPVWGPLFQVAKIPEDQLAEQSTALLEPLRALPAGTASGQLNSRILAALLEHKPQTRVDWARVYGDALAAAYRAWSALPAERREEDPALVQLAAVLHGPDSPVAIPRGELPGYFSRDQRNKHRELEKQIDSHQVQSPGAPPRAMAVEDGPIEEPQIFLRGNHARRGERVPRQFLYALAGPERQPFTQGSGRLELARAIAAADNPLTRRVLVNRIWMHHFGQPLVSTPSDFGVRSEPPIQRELLDYLAWLLLDKGWSIKSLQREILCSATYRQASRPRDDGLARDPENARLWRMNGRRLEFEALRDALFFVGGELDLAMGGRPAQLFSGAGGRRRAVYGLIDRQDLPGVLRVFDFASPDQSASRRPHTTVPQQALFLMNSALVTGRTHALVARLDRQPTSSVEERIAALYRIVFARGPTADELAVGRNFLQAARSRSGADGQYGPWHQYAQLLLMTNEFTFVD